MKKNIIYILLIVLLFNACEKDDICLLPNTPKLILRFYDSSDNTKLKNATNLSIIAESKTDSLYTNQNLDSIAIPLNVNSTQTIYNFKTSSNGSLANNKYNKLTLNYTTEEIFISRSCGFKTIFKNIIITSDNGWFQSFTPDTITIIENENNAHIKIFH